VRAEKAIIQSEQDRVLELERDEEHRRLTQQSAHRAQEYVVNSGAFNESDPTLLADALTLQRMATRLALQGIA
jgi:hypothetical protein